MAKDFSLLDTARKSLLLTGADGYFPWTRHRRG